MTKKYPFFRDEDEQTKAVIGEDAITADLNGTYQKPYAVLTQKRLYCKNEMGNFITDKDKLLETKWLKGNNGSTWFLWTAFLLLCSVVVLGVLNQETWGMNLRRYGDIRMKISLGIIIASLVLFLIFRKKYPKTAPIFICVHPICSTMVNIILQYNGGIKHILPRFFNGVGYGTAGDFILSLVVNFICVVPIILYYAGGNSLRGRNSFEIIQTAGVFSFDPEKYTIRELKNFENQVKALQIGGTNGQ